MEYDDYCSYSFNFPQHKIFNDPYAKWIMSLSTSKHNKARAARFHARHRK